MKTQPVFDIGKQMVIVADALNALAQVAFDLSKVYSGDSTFKYDSSADENEDTNLGAALRGEPAKIEKSKTPRSKKEKPPEPEKFPETPKAAPELKMSDLDLGDNDVSEPAEITVEDLKKELQKLRDKKGISAIADLFSRFEVKHLGQLESSRYNEVLTFIKATQ